MWILQDIEALYKDSSFEVIQVFLVNMQNGKLHISKLVKKATKKKKPLNPFHLFFFSHGNVWCLVVWSAKFDRWIYLKET